MLFQADLKNTKSDCVKRVAHSRATLDLQEFNNVPKIKEISIQKIIFTDIQKKELTDIRSRWRAEDTAARESYEKKVKITENIELVEQRRCLFSCDKNMKKEKLDKEFQSDIQKHSLLIGDEKMKNFSTIFNGRLVLYKIPSSCEATLKVPIFEIPEVETSPLTIITTKAPKIIKNDIELRSKRISSAVGGFQSPKNLISSDKVEDKNSTTELKEQRTAFKQHKTILKMAEEKRKTRAKKTNILRVLKKAAYIKENLSSFNHTKITANESKVLLEKIDSKLQIIQPVAEGTSSNIGQLVSLKNIVVFDKIEVENLKAKLTEREADSKEHEKEKQRLFVANQILSEKCHALQEELSKTVAILESLRLRANMEQQEMVPRVEDELDSSQKLNSSLTTSESSDRISILDEDKIKERNVFFREIEDLKTKFKEMEKKYLIQTTTSGLQGDDSY